MHRQLKGHFALKARNQNHLESDLDVHQHNPVLAASGWFPWVLQVCQCCMNNKEHAMDRWSVVLLEFLWSGRRTRWVVVLEKGQREGGMECALDVTDAGPWCWIRSLNEELHGGQRAH